ncbi:seryl-tRNA synthetase [Sistotremastrum niveocremeum HHB9708]|uniref:serine--tRNA ligase n=1 Tax=Sistotremastrum niveocremeum HHB9708 TaxID=1314777 RepID=A0A164XCM6_9AGAM|nr:seryl-tRNA synthetase [Sistotremastrum niveocremeum HHB9708]
MLRTAKSLDTSNARAIRRWIGGRCIHASPSNLPKPRLNIRALIENKDKKIEDIARRNVFRSSPSDIIHTILALSEEHQRVSGRLHSAIAASKALTNDGKSKPDPEALRRAREVKALKKKYEDELAEVDDQMSILAESLPNDTHPQTPLGPESNAKILEQYPPTEKLIPPSLSRDHLNVAKTFNLIDLEAGAKVTGSSWAYLLNEGAMLEHALVSYALSTVLKHGFTLVAPPDVIRTDIAARCGFHPREHRSALQQSYTLGPSEPGLVLAGTAEIPLAGLYANTILDLSKGPKKLVSVGKAFRAEAGARGKDTKGLYRLHQFTKVEMFVICEQKESERVMEDLKNIQLEIIRGLGIPYRLLDMPSEELGATAYRKYDVEAWMPGRGSWGEITSLSNCTDYQARRLLMTHRRHGPSAPEIDKEGHRTSLPFVHTLNGTAAAIPRLIIALLENGVVLEGGKIRSLRLPSALRPSWFSQSDKVPIEWI